MGIQGKQTMSRV